MAYNGTGVFQVLTPPTFPAVDGTVIQAASYNTVIQDLANGLSVALPRDGQAAMTGALNMGAFKVTNAANGAASQDLVTKTQLDAVAADVTAVEVEATADALRLNSLFNPLCPCVGLSMNTTGSGVVVNASGTNALLRDDAGAFARVATFSLAQSMASSASGTSGGLEPGLTMVSGTWYYVWLVSTADGTSPRLIVSASATTPILTGLTSAAAWGLLGAVLLSVASFIRLDQRGHRALVNDQIILNGATTSTPTTFASIGFGGAVPPIAKACGGWAICSGTTNPAAYVDLRSMSSGASGGRVLIGPVYQQWDIILIVSQSLFYATDIGAAIVQLNRWEY